MDHPTAEQIAILLALADTYSSEDGALQARHWPCNLDTICEHDREHGIPCTHDWWEVSIWMGITWGAEFDTLEEAADLLALAHQDVPRWREWEAAGQAGPIALLNGRVTDGDLPRTAPWSRQQGSSPLIG